MKKTSDETREQEKQQQDPRLMSNREQMLLELSVKSPEEERKKKMLWSQNKARRSVKTERKSQTSQVLWQAKQTDCSYC